jgi:hypothetical protein
MIDLLLDALAAYRLTRLVTADTILDEPREAIVRAAYERAGRARRRGDRWTVNFGDSIVGHDTYAKDGDPTWWADTAHSDPSAPKLATLVTCRWCAGMWIAAGVVAARRVIPSLWKPLGTALAMSAAAALLARAEED